MAKANINDFIEGLRISVSEDIISDYETAGKKMREFLEQLDKSIKLEGDAIEFDPNSETEAKQSAETYLSSNHALEFDISVLRNLRLDDDQQLTFLDKINEMQPVDPPERDGGGGGPIIDIGKYLADKAELIQEVARCLGNGEWKTHWWGWEVGIGNNCANKLSDLILGAGATGAFQVGKALEIALLAFIETGQIALTIPLSGFTGALTIIALYAIVLALVIKLVNGENGVWVQGNWPWPIPFVSFPYVWAISR